ncbi:MAG: hypothetical protein LC731_03895 [Acidobacteria bacterium]|nr:hypothetical protein [Acidobacteriota bacterium]
MNYLATEMHLIDTLQAAVFFNASAAVRVCAIPAWQNVTAMIFTHDYRFLY